MNVVQQVSVAELLNDELSDLQLQVISGEQHLENAITHPRVQKPGLAFAGYYAYIKPGRVQIVGESELARGVVQWKDLEKSESGEVPFELAAGLVSGRISP